MTNPNWYNLIPRAKCLTKHTCNSLFKSSKPGGPTPIVHASILDMPVATAPPTPHGPLQPAAIGSAACQRAASSSCVWRAGGRGRGRGWWCRVAVQERGAGGWRGAHCRPLIPAPLQALPNYTTLHPPHCTAVLHLTALGTFPPPAPAEARMPGEYFPQGAPTGYSACCRGSYTAALGHTSEHGASTTYNFY